MRPIAAPRLASLLASMALLAAACEGSGQAPSEIPAASAQSRTELAAATPAVTPSPSPPSPRITPSAPPVRLHLDEIADRITAEAIERHLAAIADVTDQHGGDRPAGSDGVDALREHVTAVLERSGYAVTAHSFELDGVAGTNLVVERPGDSEEVVMLGAHLDTVAGSPGLNDDGSGVAAVLTVAEALAELPAPHRTIRLALWDAEEGGPFGSRAYVASLSDEARSRIRAYLNLDMIGSPNAVRFVYDEPAAAPGSADITERLVAALERAGLAWDPIDLEGDSDHGPFTDAGIPTGGLFSGGIEPVTPAQAERHGATPGMPADPCSHRPCDTLDNVNASVAAELARVVAVVLVELAAAP